VFALLLLLFILLILLLPPLLHPVVTPFPAWKKKFFVAARLRVVEKVK